MSLSFEHRLLPATKHLPAIEPEREASARRVRPDALSERVGLARMVEAACGETEGSMGAALRLEQALLAAGLIELQKELFTTNDGLLRVRAACEEFDTASEGALPIASESLAEPAGELAGQAAPTESPALHILRKAMGTELPAALSARIEAFTSGGRPLEPQVQRRIEGALGADLSSVRVHTDALAANIAKELSARAFTVGEHIGFQEGAFDPASQQGQELLLHELTHVMQHQEARLPSVSDGEARVSEPGEPAELEAEAVAARGIEPVNQDQEPVDSGIAPPELAPRTLLRAPERKPEEEDEADASMDEESPEDECVDRAKESEDAGPEETDECVGSVQEPAAPVETPADSTPADALPPQAPSAELHGTEGASTPGAPASAPSTTSAPSATPAPASTTSASTTPSSIGRQPDGLVDYYMETHWDSVPFYQLCAQVGMPGNSPASTIHALDPFLPPDTDPAQRETIGAATAFVTGVFDAIMVDNLVDRLGVPGEILGAALDAGTDASAWMELGDTNGALMDVGFSAMESVLLLNRAYLVALKGFLDQTMAAMVVLTTLAVALSSGALLPIVGPVTKAYISLKVVLAFVRAYIALIESVNLALAMVQAHFAKERANKAQIEGDFRTAAAYRGIARSKHFEGFVALLHGILGVLGRPSRKKQYKMVLSDLQDISRGTASLEQILGIDSKLPGVLGVVEIADEAASGTSWYHQLPAFGTADEMRSHDTPSPSSIGGRAELADILRGARADTVERFDQLQKSLDSSPPAWTQTLVNGIASPEDTTFQQAASPSYWVDQVLRQVPELSETIQDMSPQAVEAACDLLVGVLSTDVQALADLIPLLVSEIKPQLGEVLARVEQEIGSQRASLERLRGYVDTLQSALQQGDEATEVVQELDARLSGLVQEILGNRLDSSDLALPEAPPKALVAAALLPVNKVIEQSASSLEALRQSRTQALLESLGALISSLGAQIEFALASLATGGESVSMVEAELAAIEGLVGETSSALEQWDGTIQLDPQGAIQYLQQVAAYAREMQRPAEEEADPWPGILEREAQPAVDAWRAEHGQDVEQLYVPDVPPQEIEACREVHARIVEDPALPARDRANADQALDACTSLSGARGREAVEALWKAEEKLLG